MKKGIIVLLIAVLAVGFAFADVTKFTGSAAVTYTVGLDEDPEFGFDNPQTKTFKFKFEFASADVDNADHQTEAWAEIGAEAWAGYVDGKYKDSVEITKANIHIKDLTINILGPQKAYDYVASFTTNADGDPNFDWANAEAFDYTAGGVELLYGGYSLSIAQHKWNDAAAAATGDTLGDIQYFTAEEWDEEDPADYVVIATDVDYGTYAAAKVPGDPAVPAGNRHEVFVGAETKAFELAEGMTVQAAANGLLYGTKTAGDDDWTYEKAAGGAFKFNYEVEKITAGVAVDAEYLSGGLFSIETLATGKYDFVSASVYFGFIKIKDVDDPIKVLEAKAAADIPVGDYKVSVTAEADRLLYVEKTDAQKEVEMHFNSAWAGYTVTASTTIDKIGLGAYFNYNQTIDTVKKAKQTGMNFGVKASYALEKATIAAEAAVNFADKLTDGKYAITAYSLKPSASITSTAIVENCTLKLAWSDARILFDEEWSIGVFKKTNGKITASATVAFK